MVPLNTLYWALATAGLFAFMLIIVQGPRRAELWPFGFWMGLVQAIFIMWAGHSYLTLFESLGDPKVLGVPVFTSLSWVPVSMIFARFFPIGGSTAVRIGYILMFAVGASIGQYTIEALGMWRSVRWSVLDTFLLAVMTHAFMTAYLYIRRARA